MNTLRYAILWAAVAVAAMAGAERAEDLRLRILAKPGVISCNWEYEKEPKPIRNHGEIYEGTLSWYYDDEAGVRRKGFHVVQIQNLGDRDHEKAVWLGDPPEIDAATDALGTDDEIVAALGKTIIKARVNRDKGDLAATVTGVEEIDGKPVEFKAMVYRKGGSLVSGDVTEKAAEAVKK